MEVYQMEARVRHEQDETCGFAPECAEKLLCW